MASKIDQSLDAILASKPRPARKSRPSKTKATNGVKKSTTPSTTRSAKTATKPKTAVPESSKIIVHGLPIDVTEAQIKEYMRNEVAPVHRCELAYNAQGVSKGTATITFRRGDSSENYAAKACALLNGRSVDAGGPRALKMRVEIITEVPQPGLADRLNSLPKNVQQTIARGSKKGSKGAAVPVKGDKTKKPKKAAAPGRIQKVTKTAEELDADMADYFATK